MDASAAWKMRKKTDLAPSKDQVLWTETDVAYDFAADYNFVGPSSIAFFDGRAGRISEHFTDFRHVVTRRVWLAFLLHGGLEWQRLGFDAPDALIVPRELDIFNTFLAMDFRFSEKDMVRLQVQPGFYTDREDVDAQDFNAPLAMAYTRVPSRRFQWAVGLSVNSLREKRILPGGGFRWQMTDRWKLKFMLPTPQIEYKAGPAVHVWAGADFRGETYRMSRRFGTAQGIPALNNALLDYEEIRVGTGVSWNVRPLIELNGEAGFMMDRQFNYYNNGIQARGTSAPYVAANLRILFQIRRDGRPMDQQMRSMQMKFPSLNRIFKLPH